MICVDASGNACYNLPFNAFAKGFVVVIANVSFFCCTWNLLLLTKSVIRFVCVTYRLHLLHS